MFKKYIKPALLILLYSLIFCGVGMLIAFLIANNFKYLINDVLFVEGGIVLVIGLLLSKSGNPSGITIWGFGQQNAQYIANLNLEVLRMERASTGYYKNFIKNNVFEFAFSNLTIILSGVFIIVLAAIV